MRINLTGQSLVLLGWLLIATPVGVRAQFVYTTNKEIVAIDIVQKTANQIFLAQQRGAPQFRPQAAERMRDMIFALIFGLLIGGIAMFAYMSKKSEQQLKVLEGAGSTGATSRAMQAYQHEDSAIAIWELRHLADSEDEQLCRERVYTNAAKAALLMTRARLAKLYHEQGKDPEAQANAQIAISLLRGFPGNRTTATNLESLLEFLRVTDDKAKKERKYE